MGKASRSLMREAWQLYQSLCKTFKKSEYKQKSEKPVLKELIHNSSFDYSDFCYSEVFYKTRFCQYIVGFPGRSCAALNSNKNKDNFVAAASLGW